LKAKLLHTVAVLPSSDVERDIKWYEQKTGFKLIFGDKMYAGIHREGLSLHIQWHAGTPEDPISGASVVKFFVENIQDLFDEFVKRGTVSSDKLRRNTPWNTHEFGFYDLNNNAIFFVEDIKNNTKQ